MAEQPARAADRRRAAAVFTIVREEAVFLPIWLRYYAAHFAPEDIYVLHHVVPGGPEDRCAPLAPGPLACRARVHAPVAPGVGLLGSGLRSACSSAWAARSRAAGPVLSQASWRSTLAPDRSLSAVRGPEPDPAQALALTQSRP